MGIQDVMDAMSEAGKMQRAEYHLTLGELLEALRGADESVAVEFDIGGGPTGPHSYRGYYDDMGLKSTGEDRTVGDVLDDLEAVHETELTAYKGGEYHMGDDVPLWNAEWGELGVPVMGVEVNDDEVVLVTGDRR